MRRRKILLKRRTAFANVTASRNSSSQDFTRRAASGAGCTPSKPARSVERSSPIRAAKRRRLGLPGVFAPRRRGRIERTRATDQRAGSDAGQGHDGSIAMNYDLEAARLKKDWAENSRWKGITRGYTAEDVVRLRGSIHIEHTLARRGADKLWKLLHEEPFVPPHGVMTGNPAMRQ